MRIVSYSGGLGSFMAAYLTIKKHGTKDVLLCFTDTKTEDEDLYRFINETVKFLGVQLITLCDGRNIWQVFNDERFMGNSRIDPCSKILKRNIFRKWAEENHSGATIVFGIGPGEAHRMETISKRWMPFETEAPLCDLNISKEQILDLLADIKIEPPRLYDMGFTHNNCGGFCVKAGQRQFKLLLDKMPERYAWHESEQEKLFSKLGKRHGFLRRVVDGKTEYLGLKEFREMIERNEQCDMFVQDGCGCFV